MDLLSEPGLVEEEWLTGTVKLRPPSWEDEPKRQMTYVVVAMMWALSVWVLLTYVTLIRAIMGKEAEELLINTWGLALLFEQVSVPIAPPPPPNPPKQLLVRTKRPKTCEISLGRKSYSSRQSPQVATIPLPCR